jgi:AraC-like DNA-binding protein
MIALTLVVVQKPPASTYHGVSCRHPDLCAGVTFPTGSRDPCAGSHNQTSVSLMIMGAMMTDIIGKSPHLEWVTSDPTESFRWQTHDFPCNIARWNYHPEHEIHLIRRSTGKAFVGDYIGEFGPGCLTVVGPNLPHNWVSDLESGEVVEQRDVVIQFDAAYFTRAAAIFPEVKEIVPLLTAWQRGLQFHGETANQSAMLMEEIGKADGFHRLVLFLELVRRLVQSSERTPLASVDYVPSLDQEAPRIIQKVMSYILDNFKDTVTLSKAAEIAAMGESSFSRFFKKNSGNNFVDYVRKLRVSHACRILSETDMPVTEVCFEAG